MARTLQIPDQLAEDSLVLVAVSAGGDSVFLAHELANRRPRLRLHLAHVNHGRRGLEDFEDARLVEQLAGQLKAGFSALELPTPVEGDHSLEERFRQGRLEALKAEAHRLGAKAIAFGHTADDAAETFLLMALRGSGPTGLGSLRPARWIESDRLWMLRPILNWTREEIRASLRERGIAWRDDPTNDQPRHRRNRLRSTVIPALIEEEPAAVQLLARSAELCADASDLLEELAGEDLAAAQVAQRHDAIVLRNAALVSLSPARLAILLRVAWRRINGGRFPLPPAGTLLNALVARLRKGGNDAACFRDDDSVHVRIDAHHTLLHSASTDPEQALQVLMSKTPTVILLPDRSSVVPVANSSQRSSPMKTRIPLPGDQGALQVAVAEKSSLPLDRNFAGNTDQRTAYLDPLSLRRDLVLRGAADGETMPMGTGGSKAIAEALQEAGVPSGLRPRVAVLADDRGVVWIPGLRRAVSAYITERSTFVLRLQWQPSQSPENVS
jgi:tRNA(Ile)-lysidine synthetase-like protein